MISGKVLRRHAGGYLVHSAELNVVFQCPLRARLKKEGVSIFTGDVVEIDEVESAHSPSGLGSAVITARHDRKNLLTRPYVANLEQVFIVQSIHQPEWNALLCDRYIVALQLELDNFRCFICLNKCDLAEEESLTALRNIYEPLGYTMLFLSAKTGAGLADLHAAVQGKTSAFIGPSGVGKSSIINRLIPDINLKVDINEDLLVGRHTTTYSELYKIPQPESAVSPQVGWIADTPGFSIGDIQYPQPADVAWQFPEIVSLAKDCKFSNCLHIGEAGCNVEINLPEGSQSRYQSYCVIVADAQQEQKLRGESTSKVDAGTKKLVGGNSNARVVPRLNERFRASSRRKQKQVLNNLKGKTKDDEDEDGDLVEDEDGDLVEDEDADLVEDEDGDLVEDEDADLVEDEEGDLVKD